MEKDQDKKKGVAFDSYNIGRKPKAEFFVNVKNKRTTKSTIKKLNPFKGKRKFITIPVLPEDLMRQGKEDMSERARRSEPSLLMPCS